MNVGAATEVELKEKKHRIEDAVPDHEAAIEEGVVAGGGVTLLRAADARSSSVAAVLNGDEATGARIGPRSRSRSSRSPATPASRRRRGRAGPPRGRRGPQRRHRQLRGPHKAGIIDAAKVTRSALQNAASIAALFLTTEAVIADKPEEDAAAMGAAGWTTSSEPRSATTGAPLRHPFRVYGRLNVTWLTPLGEDVASTS